MAIPSPTTRIRAHWHGADESARVLKIVQPGLVGLIDGTISTLAPIFAAALIGGTRSALLVGIAASLGAAISMGMSESLSDDGELTGRGSALTRGLVVGGATFIGGSLHALPFLSSDLTVALSIAGVLVSTELIAIAFIRRRFLKVSLRQSLIQVTLGGAIVAVVGVVIGGAG